MEASRRGTSLSLRVREDFRVGITVKTETWMPIRQREDEGKTRTGRRTSKWTGLWSRRFRGRRGLRKDAEAGRGWVLKATLRSRLYCLAFSRGNRKWQQKVQSSRVTTQLVFQEDPSGFMSEAGWSSRNAGQRLSGFSKEEVVGQTGWNLETDSVWGNQGKEWKAVLPPRFLTVELRGTSQGQKCLEGLWIW